MASFLLSDPSIYPFSAWWQVLAVLGGFEFFVLSLAYAIIRGGE